MRLFVVTERTPSDELNGYRSTIEALERHHVEFARTTRVGDDLVRRIERFAPDLILCAYYPHIIPQTVYRLARAVNVHPGLLPRYRGRFPTPWYILNGEPTFGIAIHLLDDGIDTGPVLVQAEYPMEVGITGHAFYRQAMGLAGQLVIDHFDEILDNKIQPVPQIGAGSYYSQIDRRFHIDWNMPIEMIERQIRVHAKPYFPAHSFLLNRMLLVNGAMVTTLPNYSAQGVGQIVAMQPEGEFLVSCSNGLLLVHDFEFAPSITLDEQTILVRPGRQLE